MGYLEAKGFTCDLSYIISEKDDRYFYHPGKYTTKFRLFLKSWWHRRKDLAKADDYDIIFVQREAFMTGSTWFERKFSESAAKLVYDLDDAIWLPNVSDGNKALGWLKRPGKTARIMGSADLVVAGNRFLADYARRFNDAVRIIPTTIDTEEYRRTEPGEKDPGTICIGWTGSLTTIRHFEYALPALRRIREKYGEKVSFKVIGDPEYENEELGIKGIPWCSQTEVEDLSDIDIGIMPLPDTEWARGKCGLKGLQYMALEIPAVMSPVGVNTEIIEDEVNGYLADGEEDWVEKLSALIEDEALRKRLGKAARQTVVDHYSVEANKEKYLACLKEVMSEG